MQRARTILGNGMLTTEDPGHIRQRRLAQPAFHRERIAAYGETIGAEAVRMSSSWKPGAGNEMHEAMLELALRIVGKCLFNLDVASRAEVMRISRAVDAFMGFLPLAMLPFSSQIQRLPLPMMKRIRTGQKELDELIFGMIADRTSLDTAWAVSAVIAGLGVLPVLWLRSYERRTKEQAA